MEQSCKTVKDSFRALPPYIRGLAVAYTPKETLEQSSFETLEDNLSVAFDWSSTPEGFKFWLLVSIGQYDRAMAVLERDRINLSK